MYLQKVISKKTWKFLAGLLKVNDENSRIRIQGPDPDPNPDADPLVISMYPRIRIRIHPKMSWIRNTGCDPTRCIHSSSCISYLIPYTSCFAGSGWFDNRPSHDGILRDVRRIDYPARPIGRPLILVTGVGRTAAEKFSRRYGGKSGSATGSGSLYIPNSWLCFCICFYYLS